MNVTQAYRLVYDAAVKQAARLKGPSRKQLDKALAKMLPRVERHEHNLARWRAMRSNAPTTRPKCLF